MSGILTMLFIAIALISGLWLILWLGKREPRYRRNWNKFILDCTPGEVMELIESTDDRNQVLHDFRNWQGYEHSCGIFQNFQNLIYHAVVFHHNPVLPGDLVALKDDYGKDNWYFVVRAELGDLPHQTYIYMAGIREPKKDEEYE